MGLDDDVTMYKSGRMYGYEIRDPYPGEDEFFKKNTHVTGMAADDNKITINPHSNIPEKSKALVAKNEALRLYMREHNIDPQFEVTEQQTKFFKEHGGAYGQPGNEKHLRATLVSRIVTGDPSAQDVTDEQRRVAHSIMSKMRTQAQMKGHLSNQFRSS